MSNNRHIEDKSLSHQPKAETQPQPPDSNTVVDFRLDGPRRTCTFKGNRKLWNRFVSTVKAQGLSVCHVLEPFCLAYVTCTVNLSHTIKPLHIANLNVERVVARPRRKFVESEVWHPEPEDCRTCGSEPFAEIIHLGLRYFLCRRHFEEDKDRLRAQEAAWRYLA
jgi:hypothetical protein